MKVCYRKADGIYCDSADSWAKYPGDGKFIQGRNVIGSFGGKFEDFIIVDTDVVKPNLKKLLNDKLIDDTEKLEAIETKIQQEEAEKLAKKQQWESATVEEKLDMLAKKQGLNI